MRSALVALSILAGSGAVHAAGFTLTSPTIKPGSMLTEAQVFKGFGCEGKNTSPALKWSGAPSGTRSYAVTVYDPDAPTGSGWWHWVVYDVPATVTALGPRWLALALAAVEQDPAVCQTPAGLPRKKKPLPWREGLILLLGLRAIGIL